MGLRLVTTPAGPLQANCHFLYDAGAGAGFIVDPGGDAEELLEVIGSAGVKLSGILITHGHSDHLAATAEIREATGARVYGSPEARDALASPDDHMMFPGMPTFPATGVDQVIDEDKDFTVGGIAVRAITTPGHSAGSITYFAAGGLFCGDLLFRGSIGRTDLAGGSLDQLMASVRKLIEQFPPDTTVYPGHGSSTTLARERKTNPFLADIGL